MKTQSLTFGIILIMLLAMGTSLIAIDYEVSSTGTAAANGTYIEQGSLVNGKPWYQKADGYVIHALFLGGMLWTIDTDTSGDVTNYCATNINDIPPLTDWDVYPPGVAPAPTLSNGTAPPPEFTLQSSNFSGLDAGDYSAPVFTDIDGDGLLDLISGEKYGQYRHYEQDLENSLSFTLVTSTFNSINLGMYSNAHFTDLDGDGLLDMMCGHNFGDIHHYEQDSAGSASFTLRTSSFAGIDVGYYSCPTFTDLDGDGLLDMLVGRQGGNLWHYEQDEVHSTSFTQVTTDFNDFIAGSISFPTFTDPDDDGLLDLMVGDNQGVIHHFEQDEINSTSFSFVTHSWQDIDLSGHAIMAFTDIDGDNYLDVLIGQSNGQFAHYESDFLSGGGSLDAPVNVTISHDGTDVTISWDAVDGASSYKIYSDTEPYGAFTNVVVENHPSLTWSGAAPDPKMFYHVIAVD